ncbi:hypothetical protein JVT61DRAFT_9837 [Boletus reticuloceps]|uniref:Uncharacterized protein n=1 Tax=Boletus reticuloceps TaxID=495285 RepID=A0A8I3A4F2_9AGAM|nr:hypothetical protein JVT61DRAFT_9837 [Boletus reticuloceps]
MYPPPPTSNTLSSHERAAFARPSNKLSRVLGDIPRVLDGDTSSTNDESAWRKRKSSRGCHLTLRDGVVLTPRGHPHKPSCLNNFGLSFRARFERLGELSDLEDAISTHGTNPSPCTLPHCRLHQQHAATMMMWASSDPAKNRQLVPKLVAQISRR